MKLQDSEETVSCPQSWISCLLTVFFDLYVIQTQLRRLVKSLLFSLDSHIMIVNHDTCFKEDTQCLEKCEINVLSDTMKAYEMSACLFQDREILISIIIWSFTTLEFVPVFDSMNAFFMRT